MGRLPAFVDFIFNNGYQGSFKMNPFEALYGRKCNTPVSWYNPTKGVVLGPKLDEDMEEQKIKIKKKMKEGQYIQTSYVDKN
jgi:hypothetical protein